MKHRIVLWIALGSVALGGVACGLNSDVPPASPIYVTITPNQPVMPIVATETPTATAVLAVTSANLLPTAGATHTYTPTLSAPITMTPSFTPTQTDTPATPGVPVAYAPVGVSVGAAGASGCATMPQGGFGAIYQSDPAIQTALGCALTAGGSGANDAYQAYQNGAMIWVSSLGGQPQPVIYALFNNGTYQRFNDTWQEGVDPASGGASPPGGLYEPVRGFGKVWRDNGTVHDTLGWATTGENGGTAQVLLFERGEMIYISQAGQVYILVTGAPGTWSARAGTP